MKEVKEGERSDVASGSKNCNEERKSKKAQKEESQRIEEVKVKEMKGFDPRVRATECKSMRSSQYQRGKT